MVVHIGLLISCLGSEAIVICLHRCGVVNSHQFLQEEFASTSTINDFIASSQLVVFVFFRISLVCLQKCAHFIIPT